MKEFEYSEKEIELIKGRSDANMRYYASLVTEQEYEIPDDELVQMPEDMDTCMREFVSGLERDNRRKMYVSNIKKFGKRCAVIALVIAIAGGVPVMSVDAWRLKAKEFFVQQGDGHFAIVSQNQEAFQDWDQYYNFSRLPEEYELIYSEERQFDRTIAYSNGKTTIILEQHSPETIIKVDEEHSKSKEVIVRGSQGIYTEYYHNGEITSRSLIWYEDGIPLKIRVSGENSLKQEDIELIAEKIKSF